MYDGKTRRSGSYMDLYPFRMRQAHILQLWRPRGVRHALPKHPGSCPAAPAGKTRLEHAMWEHSTTVPERVV